MENINNNESNKLVFKPVETDRDGDIIFYDYIFEYTSNESKFNVCFDFGRSYSDEDMYLVEQMKINGKANINGHMCNGEVTISTKNGFTSFHIAKYGDSSSGSVDLCLKNELCIEAIEQWLKHWKANPSSAY